MAANLREAFAQAGFEPVAVLDVAPTVELAEPSPPSLDPALRDALESMGRSPTDPATLLFSIARHAVDRYRERFKPDTDFKSAKRELYEQIPSGRFIRERPYWLNPNSDYRNGDHRTNIGYLVIAEGDIAFPIRETKAPSQSSQHRDRPPLTLVTCLYRVFL